MKHTKHALAEWVMATRPWSFPASAMPVVVVVAYLYGDGAAIDRLNGVCALLCMVLFQAASNVWSDYFDFHKGVDAADTYGVKILTSGQFAPAEIRRFGLWLFAVAILMGAWMVARAGIGVAVVGACGTVCTPRNCFCFSVSSFPSHSSWRV